MGEGKWASGRWEVKDGMADEFMGRWRDWLEWTGQNVSGFRWARLLRSEDDAMRFTSISEWDDDASVKNWKLSDDFKQKLAACRELCDEFVGGDFDVVVTVTAPASVGG